MIKKITKIKNLGIFKEFNWASTLPEFKRFNLFYGWNGSGKTTLSQLFGAFETGILNDYPDLEYKIQTDNGEFAQNTQLKTQIRVFNRDYISANLDITSSKAKPIYILGEKNKELAEIIKQDEKILYGDPEKKSDIGLIKELELKKKDLEKKETEKGKYFTDVAKIISTNTSGVSARNYRKNNAELSFSKLAAKQLLTDKEIANHALTLKQQEKLALDELSLSYITEEIDQLTLTAELLLKRTVATVVIDRLKENPDISKWVEQGIALHTSLGTATCEFCNQKLPPTRLSELLAFFNEADKKLKDEIDILEKSITQAIKTIENISILDKANLYDELQADYVRKAKAFVNHRAGLIEGILNLNKEVENKKMNTTCSLELVSNVNTTAIVAAAEDLNIEIRKHNAKSGSFAHAKAESITKLENHYLSEIFDDVKNLDIDIVKTTQEIQLLVGGNATESANIGITKIQQRIVENKAKISTSGAACDEINQQLKTFLGRDELTFEVADGGYLIKRKDKIAKNLSEGEKNRRSLCLFYDTPKRSGL